jgi:uncharacterized protein YcbK (DUF882 family)
MGVHQTKELLHCKGNSHQTQETAHRMGENLFQLLIQWGLTSKMYRELKILSPQRMKKWAHKLNTEFSKEETQVASKFMKKCSISLVIKEIQIKTLRFYLTPVRMAIIRGNNNKCW